MHARQRRACMSSRWVRQYPENANRVTTNKNSPQMINCSNIGSKTTAMLIHRNSSHVFPNARHLDDDSPLGSEAFSH
jgi:hypothetical protein